MVVVVVVVVESGRGANGLGGGLQLLQWVRQGGWKAEGGEGLEGEEGLEGGRGGGAGGRRGVACGLGVERHGVDGCGRDVGGVSKSVCVWRWEVGWALRALYVCVKRGIGHGNASAPKPAGVLTCACVPTC